jgi:hypothetical protein
LRQDRTFLAVASVGGSLLRSATDTVLQATFSGKGGTRMMDFEIEALERLLPTARHEFGHYIVARELGFEAGDVTIASPGAIAGPGGGTALTLIFSITSLGDLVTYCEKRVQVLMAGVLAEAMENGSIDDCKANLYAETSAANDYAKWRELIRIMRAVAYPASTDPETVKSELATIRDNLWNATKEILMKYQAPIDKLSDELARRSVFGSGPPVFTAEELAVHSDIRKLFP